MSKCEAKDDIGMRFGGARHMSIYYGKGTRFKYNFESSSVVVLNRKRSQIRIPKDEFERLFRIIE